MTGLFRFNRDDSRWKLFFMAGISLIALTYLPLLSSSRTETPHRSGLAATPSTMPPDIELRQTDDLLRDRNSVWPSMSPTQIEQARDTLIREGFSPMQADTILLAEP